MPLVPPQPEDVVSVRPPEQAPAPVILDSPHSGKEYPDDFDYVVPSDLIRRGEDAFVDEIFADAPTHGATLIAARFPRTYIDPNRAATDIDPGLFDGDWVRPISPSKKSQHGVGLIWRLMGRKRHRIYPRKLAVDEIAHRIDHYWHPYHEALRGALERAHFRHGAVWHVNCHSTSSVWPSMYPKGGQPNENDYTLGTRDGTTAGREFVDFVHAHLSAEGYRVAVDDGHKGVELVRAYSDPSTHRHSVQIEINRRLYMDEGRLEKHAGFGEQRAVMGRLVGALCAYARTHAPG